MSLRLFPIVGKPVLLVGGEAANLQFANPLLALGQLRLSFALIAILIDRALVFGAELFAQIFRTPPPQVEKRTGRDCYYDNGKNDECCGVHFSFAKLLHLFSLAFASEARTGFV